MDKEVQSCLVPEVAPDTLPLHLHQVASICVCMFSYTSQSACLSLCLCMFSIFVVFIFSFGSFFVSVWDSWPTLSTIYSYSGRGLPSEKQNWYNSFTFNINKWLSEWSRIVTIYLHVHVPYYMYIVVDDDVEKVMDE